MKLMMCYNSSLDMERILNLEEDMFMIKMMSMDPAWRYDRLLG